MIQFSSKFFVRGFALFVFATLALFYTLHYVNRVYFDLNNYKLWRYQIDKLENAREVVTIFVGDSSLGNALDAARFEELSGQKTLSVPLMGTVGFEGVFNMIRFAKRAPSVKNIIIITTLREWNTPFKKEAYFETLGNLGNPVPRPALFPSKWSEEYMRFLFNIYDVSLYFSLTADRDLPQRREVDPATDYVVQGDDKFSNGTLKATKDLCFSGGVHEERKLLFHALDDLCVHEDLNCIYVFGPLHKEVAACSSPQINTIREIVRSGRRIIPIEKIFTYPGEKMGDAVDHINNRFREEVTKEYFEAIKPFLRF